MRISPCLSLLVFVFAVALGGCGDDANNDAPPAPDAAGVDDTATGDASEDATPVEDTLVVEDVPPADATDVVEDGPSEDSPSEDVATGVCDRNGFVTSEQVADGEAGFANYTATTGLPADGLSIELLYEVLPALPYGFSFDGENYKTCETCVTIRTNVGCQGSACVRKIFLAQSGELEVTTWDVPGPGARFAGTLTNIKAAEVTLAGGMDFTSELVEDGELWCVDSLAFDAELVAW
jgi:hypothetical protein